MSDLHYYVGADVREPEALAVTIHSAVKAASRPLKPRVLWHQELRAAGYFNRPWRIDETGQFWDERDGKPFSVEFSHTRFLTPILAKEAGFKGWALFTDCDWLWLEDPYKLLAEVDDSKTVMVVPHNFAPTNAVKMDNRIQSRYSRKLWSALALWNLNSKKLPTIEMVNQADGGYLHRFEWLDQQDIGFVSEAWHWIAGHSPTTTDGVEAELAARPLPINAIHFTDGPPVAAMTHRVPTPFDSFWLSVFRDTKSDE